MDNTWTLLGPCGYGNQRRYVLRILPTDTQRLRQFLNEWVNVKSNVTMRRVRVTIAVVESAIIIIIIIITYSEWAFLALVIQLAKRMRRIIL